MTSSWQWLNYIKNPQLIEAEGTEVLLSLKTGSKKFVHMRILSIHFPMLPLCPARLWLTWWRNSGHTFASDLWGCPPHSVCGWLGWRAKQGQPRVRLSHGCGQNLVGGQHAAVRNVISPKYLGINSSTVYDPTKKVIKLYWGTWIHGRNHILNKATYYWKEGDVSQSNFRNLRQMPVKMSAE